MKLIKRSTDKKVLLWLLREFTLTPTITSLAKGIGLSRVSVWKSLKKLEAKSQVLVKAMGSGKTSTFIVKINWGNPIIKKSFSLYLLEEALIQERWRSNFAGLEKNVNFLIIFGSILHSPQQANDIDLIGVTTSGKFAKLQQAVDQVQKTTHKKIHIINFTQKEFQQELLKPNKVFIDAVRKGIILFGQDKFIKLIEEVSSK